MADEPAASRSTHDIIIILSRQQQTKKRKHAAALLLLPAWLVSRPEERRRHCCGCGVCRCWPAASNHHRHLCGEMWGLNEGAAEAAERCGLAEAACGAAGITTAYCHASPAGAGNISDYSFSQELLHEADGVAVIPSPKHVVVVQNVVELICDWNREKMQVINTL